MWHFHIRQASLSDLSFNYGFRVSKTRDVTFHYSFKRCLTYYIEKLHNASLLIPPKDNIFVAKDEMNYNLSEKSCENIMESNYVVKNVKYNV